MTPFRGAVVLGLGLIGGSVARGLAARGVRVAGWDADARTLAAAVGTGVVEALPPGLEGVERAEVVVLAVPVLAAGPLLRRLAPLVASARLVTDAGSTKRSVVRAAEEAGLGARFVGSHPLAGDHRSGWEASREGLFEGARVYLAPCASSSAEAMGLAGALWEMLGARPETVDAAGHDRLLAWSSHAPQALASALARALAGAGVGRAELGPGGRDMTRLAGSSPELWAEVALDNRDELLPALAAVRAELRGLGEALERGDAGALRRFFAEGRAWWGEG